MLEQPNMNDSEREKLQSVIGGVLFNVRNFPEPAQKQLLGQNMRPLNDKITDVILAAGYRLASEVAEDAAQIAKSVESITDDPIMESAGRNAAIVIAAAIRAAYPAPTKTKEKNKSVDPSRQGVTGWFEWVTPGTALTRVAYVYESGRVYFPEGDDGDESDFLIAAACGNAHQLVRAAAIETEGKTE